jgi:glucokinase
LRGGLPLPDHTEVVVEAATDPRNPSQLCRATVDGFDSASEAGNLALKAFATGGINITGGVALHLLPLLEEPHSLQAFMKKGRFKDMMSRIPIHVITTRAALFGAAAFGLEKFENHMKGV